MIKIVDAIERSIVRVGLTLLSSCTSRDFGIIKSINKDNTLDILIYNGIEIFRYDDTILALWNAIKTTDSILASNIPVKFVYQNYDNGYRIQFDVPWDGCNLCNASFKLLDKVVYREDPSFDIYESLVDRIDKCILIT